MQLQSWVEDLRLRIANKSDLDEITCVVQAGFPDDPEFNYRFPYRDQYPEDNRKWVRKEYEEYIDQPNKFAVMVVTTPVGSDNGTKQDRVVSLAVWDMSTTQESTGGDLGIDTRRDVNKAHFREFARCLESGFERYFSRYGDRQYHLWLLVTHPEFRRRGCATMLCYWGLKKAAEKEYMVTVLGSPMGTNLYKALGFKVVGTEIAQVEGEDEKLTVWCLEYKKVSMIAEP